MPALEAGALSYLLKNVDPQEIVAAIKKASIGEIVLHPLIAARLIQNLKVKQPPPEIVLRKLSKREKEILEILAQGLSKAEMANKLFISENTVKSHIPNIMGKLDLKHRTQAAVFAWSNGLVPKKNVGEPKV